MSDKKITWAFVKREIHRMDKQLTEDDGTFMVAALLMASTIVGPNRTALRKLTGLDSAYLDGYARMFETNGLWKRGKVAMGGDWFGKDGGIAFWMDVCVAQGLLNRAKSRHPLPGPRGSREP